MLNVLKPHVTAARQAKCSPCRHAVKQRYGRKLKAWCGCLFDGDYRDYQQRATLTKLTADPAEECPIGEWPAASPEDFAEAPLDKRVALFHHLWSEIHDPTRHWTPEWWQSALARVGLLQCVCRAHAEEYAKGNPIPFGDDGACHLWGYWLHQSVNERKGVPGITVEEFRERYRVTAN